MTIPFLAEEGAPASIKLSRHPCEEGNDTFLLWISGKLETSMSFSMPADSSNPFNWPAELCI